MKTNKRPEKPDFYAVVSAIARFIEHTEAHEAQPRNEEPHLNRKDD